LEPNEIYYIAEIKKGNASVFKEVYRLYYSSLCRFANKYFNDTDEVEDIVQDIMVKLWEQRQKHTITNLKTYLFSAVKNSCINRLNHLKVVQKHGESASIELKLLELEYDTLFIDDDIKSLQTQVLDAIDLLPEQCCKIVKMKYIEGMKSKDIAQHTNLSQRTVETHIYQGLKTLSLKFKNIIPLLLCVAINLLK
jgi:RNA polymerase sigma-70 factor (ECF subfamily)